MSPGLKPEPLTTDAVERRAPITFVDLHAADLRLVGAEDLARVGVLDDVADAVDVERVAFLDAGLGADVEEDRAPLDLRDLPGDARGVARAAEAGGRSADLPHRLGELRRRRDAGPRSSFRLSSTPPPAPAT